MSKHKNYTEIEGWFMVFVVYIGITSVFNAFIAVLERFSFLLILLGFDKASISIGLVELVIAASCMYYIWKRHPIAIDLAMLYLVISMLSPLIYKFVLSNDVGTIEYFIDTVPSLIWILYLKRSNRIKTYFSSTSRICLTVS